MNTTLATPQSLLQEYRVKETSANIGRAERALELIHHDHVSYSHDTNQGDHVFIVRSGTNDQIFHLVQFNGDPTTECTCEDWRYSDIMLAQAGVPFRSHICKHGLAARAWWDEYIAERTAWSEMIENDLPEPESFNEFIEADESYYREWLAERNSGGY